MLQAYTQSKEQPELVKMPEKALVLSFGVGKTQKGRQASAREIGKIAYPGRQIASVDMFNAVQSLGGAAKV